MSAATSDAILERMMSLHPKIIDLTLDRMWRLLAALGHPEAALPPVIHIAGTNGKGSTLAMIRAGITSAGQVAHAYTSPHLARFHERIRVAGTLISEEALAALLDECWEANAREEITYFEITTAAALLAFARKKADYTLLEVGLGGRLDATNVVARPALTVITPVDMDHQQYLGETIEEIAAEKAGILKRRVPCVVARQDDRAMAVIEEAAARVGAPLLAHGQHWHVREEHGRLVFEDEAGLLDLDPPRLLGAHQVDNGGTAIAALRALEFGAAACQGALRDAEWPARMQRLRSGPLVSLAGGAELWLDGGHNPAAGRAGAEALARLPEKPTYLITGILKSKDAVGFIAPFAGLAQKAVAVAIPGEIATATPVETAQAARAAGLAASTAPSVGEAIDRIVRDEPAARILICGSLYLAGEILRENG